MFACWSVGCWMLNFRFLWRKTGGGGGWVEEKVGKHAIFTVSRFSSFKFHHTKSVHSKY